MTKLRDVCLLRIWPILLLTNAGSHGACVTPPPSPSCAGSSYVWQTSGQQDASQEVHEGGVLFRNARLKGDAEIRHDCENASQLSGPDMLLHLPRNILWNNVGHVLLHVVRF